MLGVCKKTESAIYKRYQNFQVNANGFWICRRLVGISYLDFLTRLSGEVWCKTLFWFPKWFGDFFFPVADDDSFEGEFDFENVSRSEGAR